MSCLLQLGLDRGVHHIAIVIGRVPKTLDHFLTDHFRHVVGVDLDNLTIESSGHRSVLCEQPVAVINHAKARHPTQDPVAAYFAFFWIAQGIIARGRFRDTGKHGVLCQR